MYKLRILFLALGAAAALSPSASTPETPKSFSLSAPQSLSLKPQLVLASRLPTPRLSELRLRGGADEDWQEYGDFVQSEVNPLAGDGHIYQIEYALEAVKRGLLVVVIKGEKSLCIGVERPPSSKLQVRSMNHKIREVDAHLVAAVAGLEADSRVIIEQAQVESLTYRLNYEDCPTVEYISRFIADYMRKVTMQKGCRPFGCSIVLTGHDMLSPHPYAPNRECKPWPIPRIFLCEPSGAVKEFKAVAVGRRSPELTEYLEKNYETNIEFLKGKDQAQEERFLCEFVISSFLEVMSLEPESIEVAISNVDTGCKILPDDELKVLLDSVKAQKAEIMQQIKEDTSHKRSRVDQSQQETDFSYLEPGQGSVTTD